VLQDRVPEIGVVVFVSYDEDGIGVLIGIVGCGWIDSIGREGRVMFQHIRAQRFTDRSTNIRQKTKMTYIVEETWESTG
jgi:hypothetical protein